MIKQISLFLLLILLLAACSAGKSEPNPVAVTVVPAMSTVEKTATMEDAIIPAGATEQPARQTKTRPADPPSGVKVLPTEMPAPAVPPLPYPPPTKTGPAVSAYPVPPVPDEVIKPISPYPEPMNAGQALPVSSFRVVNQYAHDPDAYTQGLVVVGDGSEFIEGTGLWGQSSLRRVDIDTGEVTQFESLSDEYFGEGLTVFDNRILQLTWHSNIGFIYDSVSFELLDEFHYPHEGWGITHDGQQLIVSDGTSTIRFWDPQTLVETRQIQVVGPNGPLSMLNELEFVEGEILANVWQTDLIARISPESGEILGWIDLTGLFEVGDDASADDVLNGIAYDEQTGRLFVTGKRWPLLFEIELNPQLPHSTVN